MPLPGTWGPAAMVRATVRSMWKSTTWRRIWGFAAMQGV